MTGTPEGGAEHSADPTGTDHADRKPSRAISREVNGHRGWFQSSSWVPDEPRVRRTVAGVGDGDGWRTWHAAMADSLYGPGGFYRSSGAPARHFRTAAHVGGPWTAAIHRLAMRVERALGFPTDFTVLDVGAGGGELLAGLADLAPAHWSLTGVDVAPRPARLPERVDWRNDSPTSLTGLLLAVERLDVVPVDVVEITAAGPRLVEVNLAGEERLGAAPDLSDQTWLRKWWPKASTGDRIEIGRTRDEVWQQLVAGMASGLAVAVDYALDPESDRGGTLTGFRNGDQVAPIPDRTGDLTAHVYVESLRCPGDVALSQREALGSLGTATDLPSYDGDGAAYLAELSATGDAAELLSRNGLGGFTWLGHGIGLSAAQLFADSDDPAPARPQSTPAARTSARTSSTHR